MSNDRNKPQDNDGKSDDPLKPDPETLHTPDPQKHMEGPVSSLMHNIGKGFDTDESKEEADQEKEENM